jgi:SAM-dependent methyltransferase
MASDESSSDGNAPQIAYWNDRAGFIWTEFQERLDALFAPLTAAALNAAAPAAGERVLDIGCGCGETVLELARRVRPSGWVVGIDVSMPMSARARERVAAEKLGNAEVILADAATYEFPAARTDLLFSRFGVMFFADPLAAFANLRRAMKPGGRLAWAVWRSLADNPWASVPLEAARSLLPPQPPPVPLAPGPFAFADPDRVSRILGEAGWREVRYMRHDAPMQLATAGRLGEAAEFATRVGPLARALADSPPELRPKVCEQVANALTAHDGPDGIRLPGSIWIVSAKA